MTLEGLLGLICGLGWIAAFLASVFAIARPVERWPMLKTRGRAVLTLLAVLLAGVVFLAIVGANSPPTAEPPPSATPKEPDVDASTSKPKPAALPSAAPPRPPPAQAAIFKAGARRFLAVMSGCDDAVSAAQKLADSGDRYAAYSAFKRAADTCRQAGSDLETFSFHEAIGRDAVKTMTALREPCSNSYAYRSTQMEHSADLMNGDVSPKKVDEIRTMTEAANDASMQCTIAFMSTAESAGYGQAAQEISEEELAK